GFGAAAAAGALAVAAALVALGPAFVRSGARLVFWPWGDASAEAATVLAVMVKPGDVTVARGADVQIEATLRGFQAEGAALLVRRGSAATFSPVPMTPGARPGVFVARLFDLDSAAQYMVESDGIRSSAHAIRVVDRPTVRTLALGLRYPAYTGLEAVEIEDGGDVAAPRGTLVRVRATPTMPVRGGRLVVEGGAAVPLALDSTGALVGTLRVDKPGFYRVELEDEQGTAVPGSLDYVIDVLPDRAPTITIAEPGRDMQATRLEEVFASVEADDDYGVSRVELAYSVNGGPERTVVLHDGTTRRTPNVTAGHTFFLEELPLKPGDVISYYARARDNDAVSGAHQATSDIYFLRVRPFDRAYRQAEQGGGGGGGGEERGESPSALSDRQREIVAATFKLTRDTAAPTAAGARQRREDLATLALAQGRLREQTEALAERVRQRGGQLPDSAVQEIAAALPLAAQAMREAEERLGKREATEALSPEQRALQQLQRAEAALRDVQVSLDQQGGGGGGGGGERSPEELADLFGLQSDRLRNQYESVQRSDAQRQSAQREVDRTLERLKELAARQQRESERMRREAEAMRQRLGQQSSQGGGGGGQGSSSGQSQGGQQGQQGQQQQNANAGGTGDQQRQLAQEAEQLARTLERLSRETESPELQRSARQLQEAADAMRRAGANGAAPSAAAAAAAA
ncbi:DUF4175 family protein, partial [Roseisolibacter sp. H3M3-2]|uniref:DUF4175 family protein n=1 Tax=Roseisolibacter sp. H3M3-2 TaxID=3031323 RepID=UPI0023DA8D3D